MTSDDDRFEAHEAPSSALDGELADQLAIEESVGDPTDSGAPATSAPSAPSSDRTVRDGPRPLSVPDEPVGPRHSRRRSAAPDENLRAALEAGLALTRADNEPIGDQKPPRRKRGDNRGEGGGRKKAPWWELPALAAIAIVVAVLVKTFLIQPFYIPSGSMEKTLHGCPGCSGDRILVSKLIYDFRDPHPGDIVVFHAPPGWDEEPASQPPSNPIVRAVRGFGQLIGFVPPDGLVLVKRVIAVGGQTVKGVSVDGRDKVMISNHGAAGPWRTLNEPFTFYDGPDAHADFGPVTVPKGRLWVMGDHRNDSADSRFHCDLAGSGTNDGPNCDPVTSTVPIKDVIGKAIVIAWPPSRWRTLGTPKTFEHDPAAAGAVPVGSAMVVTAPLWLIRRRRRRSRRRGSP